MKVAVIYHYFAHYRLPICKTLSQSKSAEYTFFSDSSSGNDIKTIDPVLAKKNVDDGGLRWNFVTNTWFKGQLFLWQKGISRLALRGDYGAYIFLGNIYYLSTWIATIILKLRGKKVYFWTHGVTSYEKGIKWKLRKLFFKLSDGLLLYGHKAKDVMTENGFPKNKLHVIYNSLDYDAHLKARKKLSNLESRTIKQSLFKFPELPLLVFVGRLTHHKKLDLVLEASRILNQSNFKVNILFIGSGNAKEELQQKAKLYDLNERCNFYGPCYDDELLAQLIGVSDICVSPGEVGLTAITSLSLGTPVISHDDFNHQMPEYEAIIPKFNGDFFTRNSVEDLALKIKEWVINHEDVSKDKIRENCFKNIDEKYNPLVQTKLINQVILKTH